jgi:hypothetical protein
MMENLYDPFNDEKVHIDERELPVLTNYFREILHS